MILDYFEAEKMKTKPMTMLLATLAGYVVKVV